MRVPSRSFFCRLVGWLLMVACLCGGWAFSDAEAATWRRADGSTFEAELDGVVFRDDAFFLRFRNRVSTFQMPLAGFDEATRAEIEARLRRDAEGRWVLAPPAFDESLPPVQKTLYGTLFRPNSTGWEPSAITGEPRFFAFLFGAGHNEKTREFIEVLIRFDTHFAAQRGEVAYLYVPGEPDFDATRAFLRSLPRNPLRAIHRNAMLSPQGRPIMALLGGELPWLTVIDSQGRVMADSRTPEEPYIGPYPALNRLGELLSEVEAAKE